jgi:hypothetical protein
MPDIVQTAELLASPPVSNGIIDSKVSEGIGCRHPDWMKL